MKFFITLFLLYLGIISASDDIKIGEILSSLETTKGKSKQIYETSPYRAEFINKLVETRKTDFASSILSEYQDLTLKKIKYSGHYAVAIVQLNKVDHPYQVEVVPICFTKENAEWKLAPMVTSFEFSKLNNSLEESKKAEDLLKWSYNNSIEIKIIEQEVQQSAFFDKVFKKRLEMNATCNSPEEVVDYFFKQVELKSISGILSVLDISMDSRSSRYTKEVIIESIRLGLNSSIPNRAGWNTLTSENIEKIYLNYKPKEPLEKNVKKQFNDDPVTRSNVPYLFVEKSLNVINFEVSRDQRGYHLAFNPQLILVDSYGVKNKFINIGFSGRGRSVIERKIKEDLTHIVFQSITPSYSKSLKILDNNLNKTKKDGINFASYLSYHSLDEVAEKDEIELNNDKNNLGLFNKNQKLSIIDILYAQYSQSKKQKEYYFFYKLPLVNDNKGKVYLINLVYSGYNIFATKLNSQVYRKNEKGWSAVANPQKTEIDKLLQEMFKNNVLEDKEITEKEIRSKIAEQIKETVTLLVKRENSQKGKLNEAKVRATMQNYLSALKEKSLNKIIKYSGISSLKKNGWQSSVSSDFQKMLGGQVAEIKKIFTSQHRVAAALVEFKNKKESKHFLYGIVEQDGSYLVDFKNVVEVTAKETKHSFFNALSTSNRWIFIEKIMGKEYKDFLYQSYNEALILKK